VPLAARARRTDEYVEVLRTVWREDCASFWGEFTQLDEAVIYPKPLQRPHPPLWVGGGTDHALRRAARLGDGWIPGWRTPDEMRQGRLLLAEEAAKVGRRVEDVAIGVETISSVARDRQTAFDRGAATVQAGLKSFERSFDNVDTAIEQCIFGSVDDARRQVASFIDAGVRHFELKMVYRTMDELTEQMELWAEEIFPEYR
jgi:alkanesulfonate monooxygenase SsuD/methylene tetrahydromethanopterin reductase-like flavin-dependent oxidoreductase (luciferase family)